MGGQFAGQDQPAQRTKRSRASPEASPHHNQRRLLEDEGVEFDERDRIDLKRYGWGGPGSTPGPTQTKMDLL